MRSKLHSYKKVAHLPVRRVLRYMKISEDQLYNLLTTWIDQGIYSENLPHYKELKRNRRRRINKEKRELNEENYASYQYLKQEGHSNADIAEILGRTEERIEKYETRWFRELRSDGLSLEEIIEETGMNDSEVQVLEDAYVKYVTEHREISEKQIRDNATYAQHYLSKLAGAIDEDLSDDFLIMDLEGVQNPDEILEVAVIDLKGNVLLNTLVRPTHHIGWHVSQLTGIDDKLASTGKGLYATMRRLRNIVQGKTVLTWGMDYDKVLLNSAMKKSRIRIDCDFVCAQHIHMGVVGSSKQIALYKALGQQKQSHRALGDCKMVLEVLKEDVRMARESGMLESNNDSDKKENTPSALPKPKP